MEIAEQKRLKRMRGWGTRLGLSVEILRTRERVRLGFYLRDAQGRAVPTTEQGLTLDEIETELLKREKKKLTRKSRD
jgi:hypothetical protein